MIKDRSILICLLIALFGCFTPWSSQRNSLMPTNTTAVAEHTFLDNGSLHVSVKAYTAEESKLYLRKDLLGKGVQPLQISIQNHSKETFSLSSGSVDLPVKDPVDIAKMMMYSSLPRNVALRIASLFFWPVAIPSTIDSVIMLKSYKVIKSDLLARSIKQETIAPFSIYNRIVFVPKDDFISSFDINLIELQSLKETKVHVEGIEAGKTVQASTEIT
jgi:hypothetical protein